jgi:hypothetical protein
MTTSTGTTDRGRAREGLATAMGRVPETARATAAGARGTTSALQQIPDSKLRWLTASSIGLAAGLKVAGAPRWMQAAGIVPALFTGAAIALRPAQTAPTGAIEERVPARPAGVRGTGNA